MRSDLWGWFNRYAARAISENHPQKLHMIHSYDVGWAALRAERPDRALTAFRDGREIAETLAEPCWVLFFDYWIAETHIFYENDYPVGLDVAVKVGARAHQEQYLECPVRGRVYYTLMYIYYAMDPIGYEDKIREMMEFMRREIPLDDDTDQRILYTGAALAYLLEDYGRAEQEITYYLSVTMNNQHRQAGGYNLLRQIYYARGDLKTAFDYGFQTEQCASRARLQNTLANALLWQATIAQMLGDAARAEALHWRGMALYLRYDLPHLPGYYDAVCAYHEACGRMDEALALRKEALAKMAESGSPDHLTHVQLQYARTLGRAGEDVAESIAAARVAGEQLLKPAFFLGKVQQVEDGDYYEFEWQKKQHAE